jgi:GTPase
VADIPGLVEGAHEGRGLGDQFLRHIERTKLIVHLLDTAAPDPLVDFDTINEELQAFSERLATRPQLVVLTKMDIPEGAAKADGLQETLEGEGYEVTRISAVTTQGVRDLTYRIRQLLDELPEPEPVIEEAPIYRPLEDENQFTVQKDYEGIYVVQGVAVERWIQMLNPEQEEALARFQRQLKAMGITAALQRAGIQSGDTVRIGEAEFEWML